jgi:hypothetical protein
MLKDENYSQAFNYMNILNRPFDEIEGESEKDDSVKVKLPFSLGKDKSITFKEEE